MVTAGDVRDLVEERPDLAPAIEAVLEPDAPFTFDDLDLDSGTFGELVSRGVVEKAEDGYRVADEKAVRCGLAGEVHSERSRPDLAHPSISIDRLELALLLGAVALVVVFRLVPLPTVYREGYVVLSSNDPYFYRYWVEGLLSNPDVTPSSFPGGVSKGEPLMVTTLWLVTLALGGTNAVAGHVMAWYPVVSAAVTAVLLYALAVVVTDDRRIGLASVAMLAVIPGHALRTSLGFADHHAFDYAWLVLALLGIALVASAAARRERLTSPRTLAATATIAVGVTGQTLAWDNSPLLLVPIGGFLAADALRSVHDGTSPLRTGGPVVAGVALGAALVWLAHSTLGWHTTLVASAPLLVAIGGVGVLAAGEVVHRIVPTTADSQRTALLLAALEALGLVVSALTLRTLRPEFWTRLTTSLQGRLLADRAIAEVSGLFSDSGGWLLLLGFTLFIGVPYLAWATFRTVDEPRWLPPVTYAWYFLVLATIQARFVGELAPVLALFAGLGLVHLAERIDVARRPAPFTNGDPPELNLPDRRQFGALVLLFLLVGSLGIVQVPVKTSQVTVDPAQSDAAFWMADYSDEHGLEYPSNYVLSEWGWNRLYNYFVNGESRSYGYAQSNFQSFLASSDPEAWYDRLGSRRGFVVTTPDAVGEPTQIGTRLHRDNGSGSSNAPALAHYRLVHVTGDGAYKVFTVVPGAIIQGTAAPNSSVTASTDVTVNDASFTYARNTRSGADGNFSVRVAQPGEYEVAGTSVTVPESAIRDGTVVKVSAGGA